jgi:hypothetical protein
VGIVESSSGERFSPEPLSKRGVGGHLGWQHLQRNYALCSRVESAEDLAHTAGAQQIEQLVLPEVG